LLTESAPFPSADRALPIMALLLVLTSLVFGFASADELPDALAIDDTCTDDSCGLELRQLRGALSLDDPDDDDDNDADDDDDDDDDAAEETCGKWLARRGCDESSEVSLDASTSCDGDDCSEDTCCKAKASCDFFTVMDGCAKLAAPENVTDKVWSAKEAKMDEDLYCASAEQDSESCGKACCELKPCTKCSGQQYIEGCRAGSIGKCADCPTESSCDVGQQQTCGGVLSSCFPCKNKPGYSHYTSSSMTGECKWECDADYHLKADGKCHPSTCKSWPGECDASTVRDDPTQECKGACNAAGCCTPKATCQAYMGNSTSLASTCASVKEATAVGMVWAPLEATAGETLLCKGTEADDASCQKACCAKQSCKACAGKQYTIDCEPGTIGSCAACPSNSSCASGEYQPCGEGKIGKCQSCSNGPKNSAYTDTALENACPWECSTGYNKTGSSCTPTCSVYSCPGDLAAIESRSTMLQPAGDATKFCCQSAGCAAVASKSAVGSCGDLKTAEECESKYVLSGNQHVKQLSGDDTIYTQCKWDGSACNWGTHIFRNCVA